MADRKRLWLDVDLWRLVKERARLDGVSMRTIIRTALHRELVRRSKEADSGE